MKKTLKAQIETQFNVQVKRVTIVGNTLYFALTEIKTESEGSIWVLVTSRGEITLEGLKEMLSELRIRRQY